MQCDSNHRLCLESLQPETNRHDGDRDHDCVRGIVDSLGPGIMVACGFEVPCSPGAP